LLLFACAARARKLADKTVSSAYFNLSFSRDYCILFRAEYSDIYGRVMDHRHVGDCEVELLIEDQQANSDFYDARRLVQRVEHWLKQEGWL